VALIPAKDWLFWESQGSTISHGSCITH